MRRVHWATSSHGCCRRQCRIVTLSSLVVRRKVLREDIIHMALQKCTFCYQVWASYFWCNPYDVMPMPSALSSGWLDWRDDRMPRLGGVMQALASSEHTMTANKTFLYVLICHCVTSTSSSSWNRCLIEWFVDVSELPRA